MRLGLVLGADLRIRLYPNTGPLIRDRHQARMLETLLETIDPRWHAFTEVAVQRPSRGWIDAVLHEQRAHVALATELQSDLRRLEQLIRWSAAKAASLRAGMAGTVWAASRASTSSSSSDAPVRRGPSPPTSRSQLRAAYPAHPTMPWPH